MLDGINLHVAPGQVCALVGRSGGGKSTIVHLLMRFYDPTGGRVLLDGWDLRSLNLRSVHRHMGVVAQDTQMFATSIEENITYGVDSYTQVSAGSPVGLLLDLSFAAGSLHTVSGRIFSHGVYAYEQVRSRIILSLLKG